MGPVRYLAIYLLGGVISSLAQVVITPDLTAPVIGASGAVAGVLGAYLLLFPRSHVHSFVLLFFLPLVLDVPAVIYLGAWLALQFASGLLALGEEGVYSSIAYWAHVGGFLYGLVLAPFFITEWARRVHQRRISL
jgi:membrane associated rhomboid family serine protease